MNDPDKAYDEHRQDCTDAGICHFCEGEGCPRCQPKVGSFREIRYRMALQSIIDLESCLLADAQAIAQAAINPEEKNP